MREGWKKYQKSDATDRDVARHICFTHDYMYHVLDKSTLPGGRAIWINDLKGALIKLSHSSTPAYSSPPALSVHCSISSWLSVWQQGTTSRNM